jgi:hypothetical protein
MGSSSHHSNNNNGGSSNGNSNSAIFGLPDAATPKAGCAQANNSRKGLLFGRTTPKASTKEHSR